MTFPRIDLDVYLVQLTRTDGDRFVEVFSGHLAQEQAAQRYRAWKRDVRSDHNTNDPTLDTVVMYRVRSGTVPEIVLAETRFVRHAERTLNRAV